MAAKALKIFRPSPMSTLALFMLVILFASMGIWQTMRATEKTAIEQRFLTAVNLPLDKALAREARFAHVDVSGHYDTQRHILLDNQVWQGRAGVHVFTPFHTINGKTILVNRGWLALQANRSVMPDIPTPQDEIVLRGILNTPPVPGRMLGSADQLTQTHWPQLVTYLDITNISAALKSPLARYIVQLSDSEPDGFDGRQWKPVFLSSTRHQAYAFQWFAMTLASIVLWLFAGFRKTEEIHL